MRIFAYEHITGGSLMGQRGIATLAPEGELMLQALVQDLVAVPDVEVVVMRDPRLSVDLPGTAFVPRSASEFWPTFRRALREADAVWPIAPEHDGILERLSREVTEAGRVLLGSRPEAVGVTGSKLRTEAVLSAAGVSAIPTFADEASVPPGVREVVVKPDDGAGCQETFAFRERAELRQWLRQHAARGQVFQPLVRGEALSLSVLCCDRGARLLACNRQHIAFTGHRIQFSGVSVNALPDLHGRYAQLARAVVAALPGLWGYVGIDFIDAADGPVVVEVNPRLTTAYAGLRDALEINPARLVLDLPRSIDEPVLSASGRAVKVELGHAL